MVLRRITAWLVAFGSIPLCAAVAFGAVHFTDGLIGETIPSSSGKRGLVVGLLGIWGTVLFGFLLGQVAWVAECIAPCGPETVGPGQSADGHREVAR